MTSTRNNKGFFDWKRPITTKEVSPVKIVVKKDEENWCKHIHAQKLGIFASVGENILGQNVACQWQWIQCPECSTAKVLVK